MNSPFELVSYDHFLVTAFCILLIIFLPRLFLDRSDASKNTLKYCLVILILTFQVMDFFKVVYLFGEPWKTALPLHLCDFSALSIAGYLITGNKNLFNFAFFWGIAGVGMTILTPNSVYAFPSIDYLANQYGHTLILLGISVAIIVLDERPYTKDIFVIFGWTTLMLVYSPYYFYDKKKN